MTVEPDTLHLLAGKNGVLVAKAVDANGNAVDVRAAYPAGFSWTATDSLITVTPVGLDSARITPVSSVSGKLSSSVTARLGGVEDLAIISIDARQPTKLTLNKDSVALAAFGDTVSLVATVTDQNGQVLPGAEVTWSTQYAAAATVSSSGLVTAVGNGGTQVVARSGAVADTVSVRVSQVASSVTVEPDSLHLLEGKNGVLVAKAVDANGNAVHLRGAYPRGFSWDESDRRITVTPVGLDSARVTPVSPVSAMLSSVTARLGGKEDLVIISLDARRPTKLTLNQDSVAFAALDDSVTLVATVTDQDGDVLSGANVVWSTSDTSVATVSSGGLVTAVGNGTAQVVALSDSVAGHGVGYGATKGVGGNHPA